MGRPGFFRWLRRKYPSCIDKDELNFPMKFPSYLFHNGPHYKYDHVYLDMNGIIHQFFHDKYKCTPYSESKLDDLIIEIYSFIDQLIQILNPQKLVYIAVSGVSPCENWFNQRCRRFRIAKESQERKDFFEGVKQEFHAQGRTVLNDNEKNTFDTNQITPGTLFMDILCDRMRHYIKDRLSNDIKWKNLKVIFSDVYVPREGLHKIMDFIRKQTAIETISKQKTNHCVFSSDFDAILLGLATHEPRITIMREEAKSYNPPCELCGDQSHNRDACNGEVIVYTDSINEELVIKEKDDMRTISSLNNSYQDAKADKTVFIFIQLDVLRQILKRDLLFNLSNIHYNVISANSKFNQHIHEMLSMASDDKNERLIDDWIALFLIVGNNYLPQIPSMEIKENALDKLVNIYLKILDTRAGYLTHNGVLDVYFMRGILIKFGYMEDRIFEQRHNREIRYNKKNLVQNETIMSGGEQGILPLLKSFTSMTIKEPRKFLNSGNNVFTSANEKGSNNNEPYHSGKLKQILVKRKKDLTEINPKDDVRFWAPNYKERYYSQKFEGLRNDNLNAKVAEAYTKGLCWVLLLYFQGCPSWTWYYPYYYAPFASDFRYINHRIAYKFEPNTRPCLPFEQLMAILPPSNADYLPEKWGKLMTNKDSPIKHLYPTTYKIDMNNAKYVSQRVALLPFVDSKILLKILHQEDLYSHLTSSERRLNRQSFDYLYINNNHPIFSKIMDKETMEKKFEKIDPFYMELSGCIMKWDKPNIYWFTFISQIVKS